LYLRLAVVLGLFLLTACVVHPALAAGGGRAGLVVRFADGSVWTGCIPFESEGISGEELLLRSGLSVVLDYSYGLGGAVCKIEGDGCDFPLEDCFCQCQGPECRYWAYYHLSPDGTWEYSQVGASNYTVHDGDVEGWAWGAGDYGVSGTQPPVYTFEQLCPSPTDTPTPVPTATPTPTDTPRPTATPTPTLRPTFTPTPPPTNTPTPAAKPLHIAFSVEPQTIVRGECATLRWDVEGALAVYWDGGEGEQGVIGHEVRLVCPTASRSYTLRVVHPGGEERRQVSVTVVEPTPTPLPPPATVEPMSVPAAAPPTFTPVPVQTPEPLPPSPPPEEPLEPPFALLPSPSPTTLEPLVEPLSTPPPSAASPVPSPEREPPQPIPSPVSHLPTPRRMAVALAAPPSGGGSADGTAMAQPRSERVVTEGALLLPPERLLAYAAFAFLAAVLCGAGVVVIWRRW